ncbi:MAG TPA: amino acid adenylation domain-containing protein, partial [Longimicrobiaceae bacterium]|nr:amino acid adenylation domain-containing protein [Longimicrobiaceae bacterium]
HHIVSDGWSRGVLVREVSAHYAAFARGDAPRLPELPVQYADFAVWQREWLSGEVLEEEIGYWRERLAGAPPLLEIPTDRPRAPGQSPRAASHAFGLSPETSRRLRALSRREGATLFMTVLAGWQALLSRYADQEAVVVGSPIAGRTRRETEGLIGFFVNMLALRADLGGDPTWTGLLGRTREAALGAYAHQELPFERLVGELSVERSLTHTPVFQTAFALNRSDGGDERPRLGDLLLEPFGGGERIATFDLDLVFTDFGDVLGGGLVFRAALFEPETIARMAGHLEALLVAMAADPQARLSETSLLRGSERAQLLAGSRTESLGHPPACVHELFSARAARTPELTAVSFCGETLSYGELERRSNRLAHRLRAHGVGPEARVAVCLERGPQMVVGVLGVLKAGGAYVPLDPDYPAERLAYTLSDSGATLLVSQGGLVDALPPFEGEVVRLDADREAIAAESDEAPASGAGGHNAAYVVYTSGSTGRPKGVVVEHASLVSTLLATRDTFGFSAGDVFPGMASYAFDIWAFEVFAPLLAGGMVRLLPHETVRDVERLVEELAGTDGVHAVPALMREVVAQVQAGPGTLPRMRGVFIGGDAIAPDLLEQVRDAFPAARVWAMYGPTENTMISSATPLRRGERYDWQMVGRPLPGVGLHVVDAAGSLLPAGVPGELCLEGAGVARGYLGRADVTAARFVPDAFGAVPGARLYRTGDRVRRRADGELEFLGRIDSQVKIRGFRIEPGEIEAALAAQDGVEAAVVEVREDAPGQKRLAAYVVPADGAELSAAELKAGLQRLLPEYMVPGAFVLLDRLPLNANGKVDRRALPAPAQEPTAFVAPRTAAEEVLAGIWAEVLKIDRPGVEDDFFELGGHSLLAPRVVSRARQAFGVELPLRALFEAPSVAGLAPRIEALRGAGGHAAPPLERVSRAEPLPLSFAQQRLWLVDRLEPGSAAYNMPFALRLRGVPDVAALRRALDALVARHETLRTVFAEQGGAPVQVIHPPAPVDLEELDLRELPEAEREAEAQRLAAAEAMLPFDLARGPLLRSTLLRLGEDDRVLCFTLHHVVSDAWSMQVLVREVSALYAAAHRGEAAPLPELPVQYADYAVWQRSWFSGAVLDEQIGYWKEKLGGAPPLLEVPTDRPRSAALSTRGGSHPFLLPAGTTDGLRTLSRREGATLFMAVLAGWQALLGRYAGQEDVVVGSAIAGRTRRETEGLIGFFVNMLALRAELGGDPTWRELLGRVRETALGAYDHQELPFERLVEELGVERSLTHTPLFQAVFALERSGGADERLHLGELELEPFGVGEHTAPYELELGVVDAGGPLAGTLVYLAALFDAETIARMAGHLEAVLEAMAARPDAPISQVSLLSGAERAQVVDEWNRTEREYPRDASLHDLFAAQVERAPDAVAVVWGEELSYRELDARANRLAHHLVGLGVGPEERVGVLLERSLEMVVATLAVMKAGGCCVPVDTSYPPERMRMMLDDSAVRVMLSRGELSAPLADAGLHVVGLDRVADALAAGPTDPPRSGAAAGNLAYVFYTSGSTGRPKGVMMAHGEVAQYAVCLPETMPLGPGDRVGQASNASFDAAVFEIWGALLNGATLVGIDRDVLLSAPALGRTLREQRITHLYQTAALFHQHVLQQADVYASLRQLVFGAEAVGTEGVRRMLGQGRPGRVLHEYGPTEATVWCTLKVVEEVAGGAATVSIGRPIPNARAYVLDAELEPVPVGVAGELCVGGAGVVRGYLGRPELTAGKFVPDPFATRPGARMYRTGDRARWGADGMLEFLGRLDEQVKLRGFRIEMGEVERALTACPGVRQARAIVREDEPGDKRLVAYVVAEADVEVSGSRLREHLSARLPGYMLPSAYVVLEHL